MNRLDRHLAHPPLIELTADLIRNPIVEGAKEYSTSRLGVTGAFHDGRRLTRAGNGVNDPVPLAFADELEYVFLLGGKLHVRNLLKDGIGKEKSGDNST